MKNSVRAGCCHISGEASRQQATKKFSSVTDIVYAVGHDRPFFIIGVKMRVCYDCIAWEYWLGRGLYGDHPIEAFGQRLDVAEIGPLREEQIETESDRLTAMKKKLTDEIAATEKRLHELKSELK